jgi:hypothetical protein
MPPATDPTAGRELLRTVLETWKRGGTVAELTAATPPVHARDPDWEAGHRLAAYEIAPGDGRAGVDLVLTVKLTLARADGKTQEKKVGYVVGTGAATVVMRNE